MMWDDERMEADLRAALRGERPDPDAFRARVEEKLAALREAEEEPHAMSRAAGVVPPLLVAAGSFSGKNLAGKLLTALSMPAVVVGLFGYTLLAGIGVARGLDGTRDDPRRPMQQVYGFWHQHWMTVFATVTLLVVSFWKLEFDVLLAMVLGSTASVVLAFHQLSRAGIASRRSVGVQAGGFLAMMSIWFASPAHHQLSAEPLQRYWMYLIPLTTGVLCLALAGPGASYHAWMRKRPWVWAASLASLPVLAGTLMWPGRVGAEVHQIARWTEQQAPGPRETVEWRLLADAVTVLERLGEPRPDLSDARRGYERMEAGRNVFVDCAAADLGFVDPEVGARLIAENENVVRTLLEGEGPMEALNQQRFLLVALSETGVLGPADRETLAKRLAVTWTNDESAKLEELRDIVDALTLLGRDDLVEAMHSQVQQALVDAWIGDADRPQNVGGFANYFHKLDFSDLTATGIAIELMAHFGVPDEIDLIKVRRYLRTEAERHSRGSALHEFDVRPAATLLDFEHAFPSANELTLGAALWSWRYAAAVAALCALCLMTTIAAPAHRSRPR